MIHLIPLAAGLCGAGIASIPLGLVVAKQREEVRDAQEDARHKTEHADFVEADAGRLEHELKIARSDLRATRHRSLDLQHIVDAQDAELAEFRQHPLIRQRDAMRNGTVRRAKGGRIAAQDGAEAVVGVEALPRCGLRDAKAVQGAS